MSDDFDRFCEENIWNGNNLRTFEEIEFLFYKALYDEHREEFILTGKINEVKEWRR